MTDLVRQTGHTAELAKGHLPTFLVGNVTPEEWEPMSLPERIALIDFFRGEQQQGLDKIDVKFPRVIFPQSGGAWQIPTTEGQPRYAPEFEAVIVLVQPIRAYWKPGAAVANNPPLCASPDSIRPITPRPDRQAEVCADCVHAQFGTAEKGRGQACKYRLNCFFLLVGEGGALEEIPSFVSIPPSSQKPYTQYAVQVTKLPAALIAVTTIFGLTDAKNADGTPFKMLAPRIGRKIGYKDMQMARSISDMFKSKMIQRGIELVPDEDLEAGAAPSGGPVIDLGPGDYGPDPDLEEPGARG